LADRVYYGGQAVVEGVMMRGRKTMVTAVRRADGEVVMDTQALSGFFTGWIRKTPLLRGVVVLVEAMALGIKALMFSANVSLEEEGEEMSQWMLWAVIAGAIAFAVVIFFIAPLFLTRLFKFESSLMFNLVDGLIRVIFLISYLKIMTLLPDIKRTFAYHGAEHTVVNGYENGVPLELEAVKGFSKEHVRCGTSFIFVVLVISIFVFGVIGLHAIWLMILSRVVFIPVIASISYEAIYFGARHTENRLVRALLSPGLWLQALTTRPPDDSQIEVAIAALQKVIEGDAGNEAAGATTNSEPEDPGSASASTEDTTEEAGDN